MNLSQRKNILVMQVEQLPNDKITFNVHFLIHFSDFAFSYSSASQLLTFSDDEELFFPFEQFYQHEKNTFQKVYFVTSTGKTMFTLMMSARVRARPAHGGLRPFTNSD